MAENIITEIDIPTRSTKRRIVEEETTSVISTINIDRVHICEDVLDQEPTEISIHTLDGDEDCNIVDNDFLLTETDVDISQLDQYLRILFEESQVWKLQNSKYIIITDFENSQGKVSLNKRKIVVDSDLLRCSNCMSTICLHVQALQECLENNCVVVCEASIFEEVVYYTLKMDLIFLIDNEAYHIFYCKNHNWICNICPKNCKMHSTLRAITMKSDHWRDTSNHIYSPIEYPTISTQSIPTTLDDRQSSVYSRQLSEGIKLPALLLPETQYCELNHQFDTVLERTGIIIYTENEVLEFKDHKVFSSRCSGPCQCKAVVDGQSNLLLNINNRYFIHYGLIYEFSELVTKSRTTLYGYFSAKNSKFERMGRKYKFHYHILKHAWNAYLRMADINYHSLFSCPICKDKPDVIILDGIAMGTTKTIPEFYHQVDETQQYSLVPFSERTFLSISDVKRKLQRLCEIGLVETVFKSVIKSIPKEFANYIVYTTSVREDSIVVLSSSYPGAKNVIKHLCLSEPITGLYQFSLLSSDERITIVLLSQGKTISANELPSIFKRMYTLEILINSIAPVTVSEDQIKLHQIVAPLLQLILGQIDHLFKRPSRKIIEYTPSLDDYYNYFPSFSKNYKIPLYDHEVDLPESCSKAYPKHVNFTPGILIIACKHRICYGFQILRQRESTIGVFNLLLSIFKTQPSVIIYDNACNLHKTCMMRDPKLFRNTTFLVDRFHYRNHKCNPSYSMKYITTPEFENINSQSCEQIFSSLRRISTQIAYMRIENIFYNTRHFLTTLNKNSLSKFKH